MDSFMLISLLASLLACIIITALIRSSKLPPGPLGLPLIGHLHLLGKLPHRSLYELSKLHGPLMSLRLGSVPAVVASSPAMARQILQTHDLAFANRVPPIAANHMLGGDKDIVFSPPNAYWKLLRRLCTTDLFSTNSIRFFKPVREEEIGVLMRSVLADSIDVSDKLRDAAPQMLRPKLRRATNNIVMRMMFGKRFSELDMQSGGEESRIMELLEEMAEIVSMPNVGDFVPCIAWMDLQGIERRSKKVGAELREAFDGIINARRLANRDGHVHPPTNFFLDVLLQASSDTSIHIVEVLQDLFAGGTDTTSTVVEWALMELLSNPQKMKKAQEEIDKMVGRARVIKEEDIENLPFLKACVKETMRQHPPVPLLIPHKTNQDCKIMDFSIRANTQAYVNVWAIGRDPKIWENPTKFLPERFLEPNSFVDLQGHFFELLPFGSGRRMCPGWKLGLLSVHTILATLLQGFEWISPHNHLDTSESFNATLLLATPLVAYTTPRLPKELY